MNPLSNKEVEAISGKDPDYLVSWVVTQESTIVAQDEMIKARDERIKELQTQQTWKEVWGSVANFAILILSMTVLIIVGKVLI